MQTLTKSPLLTDQLYPGLTDDQVWDLLMGRGSHFEDELLQQVFKRVMTIFSGKLLNRAVLATGSGFVGIGPRDLKDGDVVSFIYGISAPLVLRPDREHFRIVACALCLWADESGPAQRILWERNLA